MTPEPTPQPTFEPVREPTAGPTDAKASPDPKPAADTGGNGAVGMRVVDRGTTDGLLETIVVGVTGSFFGG